MSIFKCKMCGGTLNIQDMSTVAVCEYCGTKQTLPKLTDEKRANLYDRANHFRRSNEFDKASAIYEQILSEDNTDAEAYWSLVLCKYGIEYVVDPISQRRVPTIRRAQYTSIFDDENYKSAVKIADTYQKVVYEEEATTINEIQKGILAISQKEDPFDVFICYKETDDQGKRTRDSVLAQELYFELKQEGLKVFFSRITLEDKLGTAYEPYIFAALNSAKVMVVLGSKPEYFTSVWVKNEWSRFLSLIDKGEKKVLIPAYKDMDPYNLPIEFSHLQAQDMSKLAFMQDLIHGIKKIIGKDQQAQITERVAVTSEGQDIAPLLRRAFLFLEDGEFDTADEYAEKVLDVYPECAEAYVVKLMIEVNIQKQSDLAYCAYPLTSSSNYKKAIRFASHEYRETLEGYNNAIKERLETDRKDEIYFYGINLINSSRYEEAIQTLKKIASYRDAQQKIDYCNQIIENREKENIYSSAIQFLNSSDFDQAKSYFEMLEDYKDSKDKATLCDDLKEEARKNVIYTRALAAALSPRATDTVIQNSIEQLYTIQGYKDVDEQIRALDKLIDEWRKQKQIEEEETRIRAEEERVIRERKEEEKRIKSAKKKKAIKITAILGIPLIIILSVIALIVTAFLIILFTFIIPLIQYNNANDLLNSGKYDEALGIYENLNGFGDSEQQIAVIEGIEKIEESEFEEGIKNILSSGVPVEITYSLNSGILSDNESLAKNTKHDNVNYSVLNSAVFPRNTFFASEKIENDSDEIILFESVDDFDGLMSPSKNGYRFVEWVLDSYQYNASETFKIKFNAVWSSKEYVINYDLNGGSLLTSNPSEYGIEDETFQINNPARPGYTFVGWTGTELDTPVKSLVINAGSTGDRSYVANWEPNRYTVTLDANGGSLSDISLSVVYESEFTLPVPLREGYTFAGWTNNGEDFSDGKWLYTSDVTLLAQWTPIVYSVILNDIEETGEENQYSYNEGSSLSLSVTFGGTLELPMLSRTGYTFMGWYDDDTKIDTANWNVSSDLTLSPKWKPNEYTITLNPDGGSVSSDLISVTYGEEYTLPTPIKTGYSFAGWFNNYVEVKDGTWNELNSITLVARWIANTYTVTLNNIIPVKADISVIFDNNYSGGGRRTVKISDGATLIYPVVPTRNGYLFTGWYTSASCSEIYDFSGSITDDLTLYAGWEKHIASSSQNTNIIPSSYTSSKPLQLSTDTSSANSHHYLYFVANESGEHKIYFKNSVSSADYSTYVKVSNLTANTVINDYFSCSSTIYSGITFSCEQGDVIVIEFYKYFLSADIYFYFNGFTSPVSTAVAEGKTIVGYRYDKSSTISQSIIYDNEIALPTPIREGYTFLGWFSGGSEFKSGKWTTLSDVSLEPGWKANENTITFNADGGRVSESTLKVSYEQPYTLPIPTKSGHTFIGWYCNGIQISNGIWTGNYDITLTARWTVDGFSVTYENVSQIDSTATVFYNFNYLENGTVKIDSITHGNGQNVNYPEMPIRSGYVFIGWYKDPECTNRFDFTETITQDIMLYARWRQMGNLTVHSSFQITPYDYSGINDTLSVTTNGTSVTSRKYFYFVANEYGPHSVFYKNSLSSANGAYALEITNLTTGEQIFVSQSVSNTEFVERSFNCSQGDVIVISFYRCNASSSTEVSFYFEGFIKPISTSTAKLPQSGILYTEGANYIDAALSGEYYNLFIPKRDGYTFDGWYYGTRKVENGPWTFTKNITLTAKWTPNTYYITFDANGGTLSSVSKNVKYDAEFTLPQPKLDGYKFAGWYYNGVKVEGGIWNYTQSMTLVAKWIKE